MATIIRRSRGTYGTQADGSLVPYVEQGWVDVPGQVVTAYEDSTGALLGSAAASSTPDVGGDYPGWYPFSIAINSWSSSPGVSLTGAGVTAEGGPVTLTALLAVSGAQATSSTGSVTITFGNILNVAGATATASSGGVSFTAVVPVSGAQATSSTGSITITEEAGGGTSLVPANPNFNDDITATTEQLDGWYKSVVPGFSEAGRYASATMTGSYVGRIYAVAEFVEEWDVEREGVLLYMFSKAAIDAKDGVLTFDTRCVQKSDIGTGFYVTVTPYDSGNNVLITINATHKHVIEVGATMGSAADKTSLKVATPAVNTTYAGKTFNLKTWVEGRLNTGKTWADVSKVRVGFHSYAMSSIEPVEWFIDNFR